MAELLLSAVCRLGVFVTRLCQTSPLFSFYQNLICKALLRHIQCPSIDECMHLLKQGVISEIDNSIVILSNQSEYFNVQYRSQVFNIDL